KQTDTFFHIKLNENDTKIFYFENSSLKFEQSFNFGSGIIIKDISKITSLSSAKIKTILNNIKLLDETSEDE